MSEKESKRGKKISTKELKDDDFFKEKADLKIILIGDSAVGKTNILSRYIKDDFSIETKNTVGVEFGSKIIKYKENTIKIQIWDTAGQERYSL